MPRRKVSSVYTALFPQATILLWIASYNPLYRSSMMETLIRQSTNPEDGEATEIMPKGYIKYANRAYIFVFPLLSACKTRIEGSMLS
jgi:hypothetical protein